MDDAEKYPPSSGKTPPPIRDCPQPLHTYNLPTYDEENDNSTNQGGDLLLVNKPRIVPRGTE